MTDVPTILKKILLRKAEEVLQRRRLKSLPALEQEFDRYAPPRGFADAMQAQVSSGKAAVIAEVKKASPSKGLLRDPFMPAQIALSYQQGGATCLSVLTDADFFQGCEADLIEACQATSLPVIRKDFVVDPYQIAETRAIGADCVLLIAAALDDKKLQDLHAQAIEYGLDVLIEVHDANELERALRLDNRLVGINNRDLHSFEVSLQTTLSLRDQVPDDRLLVTESGIHREEDVTLMRTHQINAFLVGEAFMRAERPGERLVQLFGEL